MLSSPLTAITHITRKGIGMMRSEIDVFFKSEKIITHHFQCQMMGFGGRGGKYQYVGTDLKKTKVGFHDFSIF